MVDPFYAVATAEDVGSYKPAPAPFERAKALLAEEGIAPDEVLHVAQSLFHDARPGGAAGFSACWIDRRAGHPGGTTPPVGVEPDITFTDLASLAARPRERQLSVRRGAPAIRRPPVMSAYLKCHARYAPL